MPPFKKTFPLLKTILVLVLFSSPGIFAQSKVDSLRLAINNAPNDSLKVIAYSNLSNELIKEPKKVLEILSEMNAYSEKIKKDKDKALCLRKIGAIYSFLNYFDKALEFTYRAADLFEKAGDHYGLAYCYNNIGNFYNYKGEFTKDIRFQERSAEYHLKSIRLRDTIKDSLPLMNSYNNIGNTYKELKKYDLALQYYNKSYAMALRSNDPKFLEMISENLGNCYSTLGKNDNKQAFYKQALFYFMNVIRNYNGSNPSRGYSNTLSSIGIIYAEMGNASLGISYLEKGLKMAQEINDKSCIMQAASGLSKAYEKKGDCVKALQFLREYNTNKDSLINERNSNSIEEMQVLYQSSQKDKEIERLSTEKRIADAELSRQRLIIFSTVGTIIFALVLAIVIWSRYNLKKRANLELRKAYHNIEMKNHQITDSINYAKRLQNSILPPVSMIRASLPNFFVYYEPRDIVSGDFYWFSKNGSKLFVIVADCTGHGVPGALMSMVGNTLLNEIINQKGILDPGTILEHLDKGISMALRQQGHDALTQDDGMDISICCVDENDRSVLKYAAANHSIFVKTNAGLTELKGDIFSIGGSMGVNAKKFNTYEYNVTGRSCVIMSSDGYYDQFGGTANGKYLVSRFEKFIIEADLSKDPAQLFKTEIEKWRGDHKQTDDILVAGFTLGV